MGDPDSSLPVFGRAEKRSAFRQSNQAQWHRASATLKSRTGPTPKFLSIDFTLAISLNGTNRTH
jgi:hypothetical protein